MSEINIVSFTHSEDLDGIGSQAIVHRYFKVLKHKPDKSLLNRSSLTETQIDSIEKINLNYVRTDYTDYLYYIAALFAQNMDKFNSSFIEKMGVVKAGFIDKWNTILKILFKTQKYAENDEPLDIIIPSTYDIILKIKDSLKNVHLLILTDLGFNPSFKCLFPFLSNSRISLTYFDHHEQDEITQKFFSDLCGAYIIDAKRCASEIIQDYFLPDDKIANKIADYSHDSDFRKWEIKETEKWQTIIGKYSRNYDVLDMFVNNFAIGNFSAPEIEQLYQDLLKWQKSQENYLMEHITKKKITLFGIGGIEFSFSASDMRPGRSLRVIEQKYEEIFEHKFKFFDQEHHFIMIAINITTGKVNINSNIINVYKIASYFGGGGHVERAGFSLPTQYIKDDVKSNNYYEKLKMEDFIRDIIELISQVSELVKYDV
ncbi:MAG: hypothetical protein GF364_11430 [Candidatus Lokiarchaeota archaeon]|nr:hypothetical protein [Candidatus Lokiarchaeota archaeon]